MAPSNHTSRIVFPHLGLLDHKLIWNLHHICQLILPEIFNKIVSTEDKSKVTDL